MIKLWVKAKLTGSPNCEMPSIGCSNSPVRAFQIIICLLADIIISRPLYLIFASVGIGNAALKLLRAYP